MELKQLSYFVAVVEEGTISSAARKLNLTQPPLSAQMKQLEAECGCVLFERTSRHIQLTEAGRMLYGRALTLLELADIARQELRDYREGTSGTLRLGVVSSVGSTLLTEFVRDFHMAQPQTAFELFEANTYQLLEQLKSNLLELAVVRTPFPEQEFHSVCILDEPLLAVGHGCFFEDSGKRKDRAEAGRRAAMSSGLPLISPDALCQKPLILYRRWESILMERFEACRTKPFIFCRNDDARTSALWADAGLGVAILPASAKGLLRHPCTEIYKIDDPKLHSGICVVHNRDAWLSSVAKSFFSYLCARTAVQPSV